MSMSKIGRFLASTSTCTGAKEKGRCQDIFQKNGRPHGFCHKQSRQADGPSHAVIANGHSQMNF